MSSAKKERQRELVEECRVAMPGALDELWDTMLHAPDVARPDVAAALAEALPDERRRLAVVLAWFGHSDGSCPVCWMLVGKLVYAVEEPIVQLLRLLKGAPAPGVLSGGALFLSTQLEPRHALPAGVSRERLEGLRLQARGLPGDVKQVLLEHWTGLGRPAATLAQLLES